jgi:hypothetical protein
LEAVSFLQTAFQDQKAAASMSPVNLERPFRGTAIWAKDLFQQSKWLIKTIAWALFAWFALAIMVTLYESLDDSGWIVHNHDTPVWIAGDWMVGEYRICGMLTTTPPPRIVLTQEVRAELPRLLCGRNWESRGAFEFENVISVEADAKNALWAGGDWSAFDTYFHVLPVRYNGRVERPDKVYISWRCQRNSGSLTCWALN